MQKAYKIYVTVSNDLATDQRVHKVCATLLQAGYEPILLGRKLSNSPKIAKRIYKTKRIRVLFNKGPLFYFFLNLQLFFQLLFKRVDIFWSNDLDTLPSNFLLSKIKRAPLVYDSHEYFTEVPELLERPKVKGIWEIIERAILPQLHNTITVSDSIAKAYQNKYGIDMKVVRNFPYLSPGEIKQEEGYILYQGALNLGRGLENLIEAMTHLPNIKLKIAGAGDVEMELKKQVHDLNLDQQVDFLGRLNFTDLQMLTRKASLGVSLEEDMGLNYRYALPNKVFDYIQARVPVLYSPLPDLSKLLSPYMLGETLESREPVKLAKQIDRMLKSEQRGLWQQECDRAARVFNWENEEGKILELIKNIRA